MMAWAMVAGLLAACAASAFVAAMALVALVELRGHRRLDRQAVAVGFSLLVGGTGGALASMVAAFGIILQ